jgi:hypothetical protein
MRGKNAMNERELKQETKIYLKQISPEQSGSLTGCRGVLPLSGSTIPEEPF